MFKCILCLWIVDQDYFLERLGSDELAYSEAEDMLVEAFAKLFRPEAVDGVE